MACLVHRDPDVEAPNVNAIGNDVKGIPAFDDWFLYSALLLRGPGMAYGRVYQSKIFSCHYSMLQLRGIFSDKCFRKRPGGHTVTLSH